MNKLFKENGISMIFQKAKRKRTEFLRKRRDFSLAKKGGFPRIMSDY